MPYINVNDAYILDNTGKQVDDAVDYALANSNRNLLDNPWFTVNQRGVANGVNVNGNNYIADRWQAIGTSGATRNSDGSITITDTIFQKIPTDRELEWKTVTLSVRYADGTVDKDTFIWGGTSTRYFTYGRATVYGSAYQINFNAFTKNVRAVKLELGSYSTLANDVPPDYAEELRKCMYYFRRISNTSGFTQLWLLGRNRSTTGADFYGVLGNQPMRTAPTISRSGSIYVQNADTNVAITDLTRYFTVSSDFVFRATVASGLTANAPCALAIGSGAYIDLSAEL